MKKLRKHIIIVCALLLFGIAFLTLSVNAASTFSWFTSSVGTAADTGPTNNKTDYASHNMDTGNIILSPITGHSIAEKPKTFDSGLGNSNSGTSKFTDIDEGPLEPSQVRTIRGGSVNLPDSGSIDASSSGTSAETPKDPGTNTGSSDSGSPASPDNSSSGSNSEATDSGSSSSSPSSGSSGSHHHHKDSDDDRSISISKITLNTNDLNLKQGNSASLTATISPSNTTQDKTITWFSSDDSIATVDSTGKVTAVEGGMATITVKSSNGKTASCAVTVSVPATGISLSLSDVPVERGKTIALIATLDPPDSTDKILWATSDNTIATVNSSGIVTGISPGSATITASVGDKGVSASCKVTTAVSISELNLSETSLNLKKGEEHMLTATILPEDTTEDKTMTWSSSDDSIATVDSSGKVTAVKGGTAIITAQTGKRSAQCMITVVVPVTGITLSQDSYTIAKGTVETLSPVIVPEDATDKSIAWGSSDQSIATVDNSGNVTAVSVGTTTITAITHGGGYVAQCTVKVVVPVTGITFDKTEMHLKKGSDDFLTAVITPSDATNKAVTWASSDESVVSIDDSGKIKAVGGGTATVTVTTDDGEFTVSCKVTVTVPVTGVSLSSSSLNIARGSTKTLTAIFSPSDATDKKVNWTSSDSSVAMVNENGIISAISTGTATITAKTHDGGYVEQCTVKVVVPVTGITLDKTEMHLKKGNNDFLTAVITPEDATNKSVTWYSSNSAVATVDSSGRVKAVGGGSAVISATTEDGQYVATCTINVVIPVTGVSVSPTALELIKGTTGTVTAAIFPSDAMDKTVFWSSSDSNIASVDSFGKISANNVGAATITAKTKDGGYTTTCAVTVKPNTFTVMAIAGSGGSVSGGGVYQAGSDVTLTATPIEHYHFVHWTGTGGSVIGIGGTYTISNLSADTTIHAIFAIDTFNVTVTAGTGGTATGGGTYPYGKVITLTATPDVGYKFLGWSDGDLTNPRNYTVNKDVMLTAKFIPLITYTIAGHSTESACSGASKEGIYFAWEQEKHNHSWAGITVTFDQQIAWKHLDVVEINRDNDVSFSGEIYSPQFTAPISSWGNSIEKFPFFNQYGDSCDLRGQVLTSISFSAQCTMHHGYADYKLIMTDMDGHKYYLNNSGNAIAQ